MGDVNPKWVHTCILQQDCYDSCYLYTQIAFLLYFNYYSTVKIPFQKFQDTKWPASHTKDAIAPVLFFVCVVIRAIVVEKFPRLMDCLPFTSSTSEKQKTEVLVK